MSKYVGVFAIAFALVASFAFKAVSPKALAHKYAVQSETATQWVLVEKLTGQTEGSNYDCIFQENTTCTVESDLNINPTVGTPITVNKSGAGYQALEIDARFQDR